VAKALQSGGPPPAGLSAEEQRAYDQMAFLYQHVPTQLMMAAHPQTLYGLADSSTQECRRIAASTITWACGEAPALRRPLLPLYSAA